MQYEETKTSLIATTWSRLLSLIQELVYKTSDEIIVISPSLTEFAKITEYDDKISVWCHYYFELEKFDIETPFEERKPVVGQVGIVSEIKGSLNFIKAADIASEESDIDILVVGDGPLLDDARKLASELSMDVEFTGRVSREQVPEQMNRMRLMVISSISEGVPKVAIEAMACGAVPISTDVGGISDFINHGETGFIIERNDPRLLAENIQAILKSEDLAMISAAGRKYVEENFSYESSVQGYHEVVSGIVERNIELPTDQITEQIDRKV